MRRAEHSEIQWASNAKTDSSSVVRLGVWSIGLLMVLFLIWGGLFQLSSAVITPGTVVSEGRNKLVQHSTGGKVVEIKVAEGDRVAKGQVLMLLDNSQALADVSKLEAREASLLALKRRLGAEREGSESDGFLDSKPVFRGFRPRGFDADLLKTGSVQAVAAPVLSAGGLRGAIENATAQSASKASVALKRPVSKTPPLEVAQLQLAAQTRPETDDELIESQRDAFRSGRDLLIKEINGLETKAETLMRQRGGIEARIASQQQLLALAAQEVVKLKPLAAQGFVARNRLLDKQRLVVEIEGMIAGLKLDAASYDNQIKEIEVQIEKARLTSADVASREYARIVAEIAEIRNQLQAAREVVSTKTVLAPESGQLTNLVVTTTGGVFSSGDVIGEIVPEGAPLLVEARVAPADIRYVLAGQKADVAITAFDRRLDDTLDGKVVYVSADATKDEKSGEQYFVTRLSLSPAEGRETSIEDLQVGMQAEVYIHTGSRTFLSYLGKPLLDSFKRAFRER